jgi:hypothetical protein
VALGRPLDVLSYKPAEASVARLVSAAALPSPVGATVNVGCAAVECGPTNTAAAVCCRDGNSGQNLPCSPFLYLGRRATTMKITGAVYARDEKIRMQLGRLCAELNYVHVVFDLHASALDWLEKSSSSFRHDNS